MGLVCPLQGPGEESGTMTRAPFPTTCHSSRKEEKDICRIPSPCVRLKKGQGMLLLLKEPKYPLRYCSSLSGEEELMGQLMLPDKFDPKG